MKVNTLKLNDDSYPAILKQIPDPPKQLFWLGRASGDLLSQPKVAVVGSRKVSPYGRKITEDLAGRLARDGVLIISGLALGVDSIAHRAALDAGGLTLAVLPASVEEIYPAAHRQLAADIVSRGGALVSEYPPGSEAFPLNFIARNRIVSGLSDGLLITEAAKASGTMHTARFALEQGKTVMAVPGNIDSISSEGCNNLIKSGAVPVTSAEDIFYALNIKTTEQRARRIFKGSPQEQQVYGLISEGVGDQEELASRAQLDSPELFGILTSLEISGYIRPNGAGRWVND